MAPTRTSRRSAKKPMRFREDDDGDSIERRTMHGKDNKSRTIVTTPSQSPTELITANNDTKVVNEPPVRPVPPKRVTAKGGDISKSKDINKKARTATKTTAKKPSSVSSRVDRQKSRKKLSKASTAVAAPSVDRSSEKEASENAATDLPSLPSTAEGKEEPGTTIAAAAITTTASSSVKSSSEDSKPVATDAITKNLFGGNGLSIKKPVPQQSSVQPPALASFSLLDVLAEQAVNTPRAKDTDDIVTNAFPSSSDQITVAPNGSGGRGGDPNSVSIRTVPSTSSSSSSSSAASATTTTVTTMTVTTPTGTDKINVGHSPVSIRTTKRRASFLQSASGLDDATALYQDGQLEVEVVEECHPPIDGFFHQNDVQSDGIPSHAFQSQPNFDAMKDAGCLYHFDDLHPCDVLVARGGSGRNHTGNLLYRHMVQYLQPTYTNASNTPAKTKQVQDVGSNHRQSKRDVAESLVGEVQRYGGRFLHVYQGAIEVDGATSEQTAGTHCKGRHKTKKSTTPGTPESNAATVGEWWYELDDIKAREKASQSLRDVTKSDTNQDSEAEFTKSKMFLVNFYNMIGDAPKGASTEETRDKLRSALLQIQHGGETLIAPSRRDGDPQEVGEMITSSVDNLKQLADVVMGQMLVGEDANVGSQPAAANSVPSSTANGRGAYGTNASRVTPNGLDLSPVPADLASSAISPSLSAMNNHGSTNGIDLLTSIATADLTLQAPSLSTSSPGGKKRKKKRSAQRSSPTSAEASSSIARKKAKAVAIVTVEKNGSAIEHEASGAAIDAQYGRKPDGYGYLFDRKEFTTHPSNSIDGINTVLSSPGGTIKSSKRGPSTPNGKSTKSSGGGGGNSSRRPSDAEAKQLLRMDKPHTDVRSETYPFPYKLFELIENAPRDICGWTDGGQAFIVHNHEEFRKKLLPVYFGHNVMRSFVRQLSYWAFDKLSDPRVTLMSHGGCMWKNTFFQEGRHDLLKLVERARVAGKKKKRAPAIEAPKNSLSTKHVDHVEHAKHEEDKVTPCQPQVNPSVFFSQITSSKNNEPMPQAQKISARSEIVEL